MCWLVLVFGFFVSFVEAESQRQGTRPIGSYSQMQKKIGYPTPKKEQLQKMLQKFVGEFEGRAFKAFSETDFNYGYLLYSHEDYPNEKPTENTLRAILWYTQNGKIFNKEMRSWYQRYGGDKTFAATNALGMTRDDTSFDYFWLDNNWRDTGIVVPGMLRTREVAYVTLYLDHLKRDNARPIGGKNDDDVIAIVLRGGQKIELVVTFTAFPALK